MRIDGTGRTACGSSRFKKARCRSQPDGRGHGRELKRLLLDHGCTFVHHGKGDHEIWFSPIANKNFTVDAGTRKRFTANAVLKQAGILERS